MLDKKIDYFITAVEEGSFSAAARKLILSQSTLSQQIAILEEDLGVMLFDRSGYRPVLTRAGRTFYEGCLKIRNQCTSLKEAVRKTDERIIRIGFTGTSENKEIMGLIRKFKQTHPLVSFTFQEGSFNRCVEKLIAREVDLTFGIDAELEHYSQIASYPLFDCPSCIICSFDHPLALKEQVAMEDLAGEEFILLSSKFGKNFHHAVQGSFKADAFMPIIREEVDTFDELIFHVSIGEGISIVSRNVVPEHDVKAVDLVGSHHRSSYELGCLKDESNETILRFVEETRAYFQKRGALCSCVK